MNDDHQYESDVVAFNEKQIKKFMIDTYPKGYIRNPHQYDVIAKDYINIMKKYLRSSMWYLSKTNDNHYYIDMTNLRADFNYRYGSRKSQKWWLYTLMKQFPLWKQITRGYSNQHSNVLTKVEPIPTILQHMLKNNNIEHPEDNPSNHYMLKQQIKDDLTDIVPISTKSLNNYIKDCANRLQDHTLSKKQRNTISKNQVKANEIQYLTDYYAVGGLPHHKNEDTEQIWGRTYYKGLNLQTQHKTLREAALGKCNSYDIKSSVFSFYCNWFVQHLGRTHEDIRGSMIYQCVNDKKMMRKTLATECLTDTQTDPESKISMIKRSINAIGFGAMLGNGYYDGNTQWQEGAVRDVIWHKGDYERFKNHWMVKTLLEEIKMLSAEMSAKYKPALQQQWENRDSTLPKKLFKSNGRMNKSVFMAYLYQNAEADFMNQVYDWIHNRYDGEMNILLRVHDGFYTDKQFNQTELNGWMQMQGFQYQTFEHNLVTDYKPKHNDWEHRQFIQKEEQLAQQYTEKRYGY